MPFDVFDADLVGLGNNGVGGAVPRGLDAQRLIKFDLIVMVLQRGGGIRRTWGAAISNAHSRPQQSSVVDRPDLRVASWRARCGD